MENWGEWAPPSPQGSQRESSPCSSSVGHKRIGKGDTPGAQGSACERVKDSAEIPRRGGAEQLSSQEHVMGSEKTMTPLCAPTAPPNNVYCRGKGTGWAFPSLSRSPKMEGTFAPSAQQGACVQFPSLLGLLDHYISLLDYYTVMWAQ